MMTSTSLSSARSSQKRPRKEPRLSPSGRTWEVIAKRFLFSISSTTWLSILVAQTVVCDYFSSLNQHRLKSVLLRIFNLAQDRVDSFRLLFDAVTNKVKRRSMPQIQRNAKLLADVRRGVLQRSQGLFVLLLVASDR